MDATPTLRTRSVRSLGRLAFAVALTAGFLFVATRLDPARSNAGEAGSVDETPLVKPSTGVAPGATAEPFDPDTITRRTASLGSLVGGGYTVQILAGEHEPLYTIVDAAGRTVASNVGADDAYRIVPDLDLRTMRAGGLMLADLPE